MKKILLMLFVLLASICEGQDYFEGELVYSVNIEPLFDEDYYKQLKTTKELFMEHIKSESSYFDSLRILIKGDDFVEVFNSKNKARHIYKAADNFTYKFINGSRLFVSDMKYQNQFDVDFSDKMSFKYMDSTKIILNDTCKLFIVSCGDLGGEEYWYAPHKLLANPKTFERYNYDSKNIVMSSIKGYPYEIVKYAVVMKITYKLVEVIEKQLSNDLFIIPELKNKKKLFSKKNKVLGMSMEIKK